MCAPSAWLQTGDGWRRHTRVAITDPGPAWRDLARCRDEDPELFYPVGLGPQAQRQAEVAKTICRACPVRETCLETALANHAEDGVWGGLDVEERAALRRRRLLEPALG